MIPAKKYKVSMISYLNSKPFHWGLVQSPVKEEIELYLDFPSRTAIEMAAREMDIGLVPVGALTGLKDYRIISNFCIGAVGKVRTVILASDVPIEETDTVLLDYQSRSSVLLARVLACFYWKKPFKWVNTSESFEKKLIRAKTAGVVIGDRVFQVEKQHPYIYDLSSEWMKFTGLPFVFAVWISQKELPSSFLDRFNQAISFGVASIPDVEKAEQENYPGIDIFEYFTEYISYELDEEKKQGMEHFLYLVKELEKNC
jgi:chorismate dehydratase